MIQQNRTATLLDQVGFETLIAQAQNDPTTQGRWDLWQNKSPILPINAVLLPPDANGKSYILFFSGSGNDPTQANRTNGSVLADYPNQQFSNQIAVPVDANGNPLDLFCAGQSLLPDGNVLASGGTLLYLNNGNFQGLRDAFVFDRNTQQWRTLAPMAGGRWYPTQVALGDGRVLVVSGLDQNGGLNMVPEIYNFPTDSWTALPTTNSPFEIYAHLFLLQDGRVFYSGAYFQDNHNVSPRILTLPTDPQQPIAETPLSGDFGGLTAGDNRAQGASVLLPPAQAQKVMIVGGHNGPATDSVNIVDLTANNPTYTPAASLHNPRVHCSLVLLPDRTVFVCNGSKAHEDTSPNSTNMPAEIYDPATGNWTQVATPNVQTRVYHSVALLLPSGRVLTAGGNPQRVNECLWNNTLDQCTGGDRPLSEELRVEVYSPPYLFRGARPVIDNKDPQQVKYGDTISIQTAQAGNIKWVHLIKPMATTHSLDTEQRLVDLPINSNNNNALNVTVTNNPNLAPPGWYMLFITDNNGIPSMAKWVQLMAPVNTQLQATFYADTNFSGEYQSFPPGVYRGDYGQLNLVGDNFTSSLRVPQGLTVHVCENADGTGVCGDFGPGDYPYIGDALNDKISYIKVQQS
jgi:hypothetical protein